MGTGPSARISKRRRCRQDNAKRGLAQGGSPGRRAGEVSYADKKGKYPAAGRTSYKDLIPYGQRRIGLSSRRRNHMDVRKSVATIAKPPSAVAPHPVQHKTRRAPCRVVKDAQGAAVPGETVTLVEGPGDHSQAIRTGGGFVSERGRRTYTLRVTRKVQAARAVGRRVVSRRARMWSSVIDVGRSRNGDGHGRDPLVQAQSGERSFVMTTPKSRTAIFTAASPSWPPCRRRGRRGTNPQRIGGGGDHICWTASRRGPGSNRPLRR